MYIYLYIPYIYSNYFHSEVFLRMKAKAVNFWSFFEQNCTHRLIVNTKHEGGRQQRIHFVMSAALPRRTFLFWNFKGEKNVPRHFLYRRFLSGNIASQFFGYLCWKFSIRISQDDWLGLVSTHALHLSYE